VKKKTKKPRLMKVSLGLAAAVVERIDLRAKADNRSRAQWIAMRLAEAVADPLQKPMAVAQDGAA
jgi:hypothetical protein